MANSSGCKRHKLSSLSIHISCLPRALISYWSWITVKKGQEEHKQEASLCNLVRLVLTGEMVFPWNLLSLRSYKWILFLFLPLFKRKVTVTTFSIGSLILSVCVVRGGSCFKHLLKPGLNCSKADPFHRKRWQSDYTEYAESPIPLFEITFLYTRL